MLSNDADADMIQLPDPRSSGRRGGAHSAADLLALVLDPGSLEVWRQPAEADPADARYARQIARARAATGLDESVIAGCGTIRGRRVAVVASEFAFLGGSIGVATASRIVAAVGRATAERLALLVLPSSGGTRIQEGTAAFVRMISITAAVERHKRSALPYLVYLRDPTTGGVLASWASRGQVTFAEPSALIGFLGPRVQTALYGQPLPADVQTAENLYVHGLVDVVVAPQGLAAAVDTALTVLTGQTSPGGAEVAVPGPAPVTLGAWDAITRTRRAERPGVRQLLERAATDVTVLGGPVGGRSLILALARFDGRPAVVVGQDRGGTGLGPRSFSVAHRGVELAEELGLPVVTVLDTPGARTSREAEEGGLAAEIARCLATLLGTRAPTLSVLLGQGCGGAALALLPADHVLAAQHAWLAPLPPEGASVILYRTAEHAAALAESQGVRAVDLWQAGTVDSIVEERPDAADEAHEFSVRLAAHIGQELARLVAVVGPDRRARREERYLGSARG